jgi:hypothetical protein
MLRLLMPRAAALLVFTLSSSAVSATTIPDLVYPERVPGPVRCADPAVTGSIKQHDTALPRRPKRQPVSRLGQGETAPQHSHKGARSQ